MIFPLLVVGVFLVGVIRVFIRPEWIQAVAGSNTVLANLAGVVFGVFMYFPTLVEVPIAKMFLSLGMHPGPLIAYLMADPELSLQSILITTAIIGKLKAWTYVGLVALFSTLAGLTYGAWVDGTPLWMLALPVGGFVDVAGHSVALVRAGRSPGPPERSCHVDQDTRQRLRQVQPPGTTDPRGRRRTGAGRHLRACDEDGRDHGLPDHDRRRRWSIDEAVKVAGRMPSKDEIAGWLKGRRCAPPDPCPSGLPGRAVAGVARLGNGTTIPKPRALTPIPPRQTLSRRLL
jgi:hypothetical protein